MTVEVVIARHGEDLSWTRGFPPAWVVTVYDKTLGGPRDDAFRNMAGPRDDRSWPGAIARPNVGFEAESYLRHIADRYDDLDDVTVFLQGDAHRHVPTILRDVLRDAPEGGYRQYGPTLHCDALGRPHHPEGLPELAEMAAIFGVPLQAPVAFQPWALFLASRQVLRSVSRGRWRQAAEACTTKRRACGMERLWGHLLTSSRAGQRDVSWA